MILSRSATWYDTATSLNNLAGLYTLERRFADAEPLYRRALAISERIAGADDASTAIIVILDMS